MSPSRSDVAPGTTRLQPLTFELTLRQYVKLKEAQRRLSAEHGREVGLDELLEVLCERFLAGHVGGGAAMSRLVPHGHVGVPNVRPASGKSFSSA